MATNRFHVLLALCGALALAPDVGLLRSQSIGGPGVPVRADATCRRPWLPPVEAPIVDPFRPPADDYGPGNRGLEYGTDQGQPITAVADGIVRFAGPVAGAPVVVIDHGAELWSTYTTLTEGLVQRGDIVEAGHVVARADEGFHLTARHRRRYIDPTTLLEQRCVIVRLVVD